MIGDRKIACGKNTGRESVEHSSILRWADARCSLFDAAPGDLCSDRRDFLQAFGTVSSSCVPQQWASSSATTLLSQLRPREATAADDLGSRLRLWRLMTPSQHRDCKQRLVAPFPLRPGPAPPGAGRACGSGHHLLRFRHRSADLRSGSWPRWLDALDMPTTPAHRGDIDNSGDPQPPRGAITSPVPRDTHSRASRAR